MSLASEALQKFIAEALFKYAKSSFLYLISISPKNIDRLFDLKIGKGEENPYLNQLNQLVIPSKPNHQEFEQYKTLLKHFLHQVRPLEYNEISLDELITNDPAPENKKTYSTEPLAIKYLELEKAKKAGKDTLVTYLRKKVSERFPYLYLRKCDLSGADLIGADLIEAHLLGTNLSKAKLVWAYLVGANLSGAKLVEADLRWANLNGANLSKANLSGLDLSGAKLNGANLSEANLICANLVGTNLSKAKLVGANLFGADLSWASGLKINLLNVTISDSTLFPEDTTFTFPENFEIESLKKYVEKLDTNKQLKAQRNQCAEQMYEFYKNDERKIESIKENIEKIFPPLNLLARGIDNFSALFGAQHHVNNKSDAEKSFMLKYKSHKATIKQNSGKEEGISTPLPTPHQ